MVLEQQISGLLVIVLTIVFSVIFLGILPILNIVFSILIFARPDARKGDEITLDSKNQKALSRAFIKEGKLYLQRASGISSLNVDVIFFSPRKRKRSYSIKFKGDLACIDPKFSFKDVKIICLKADRKKINKKVIGYPNNILNIVTSVGLPIGIIVPCYMNALYYNYYIYEINIEYIFFYVIPIFVGVVIGAAHYFLVRLVTKSFN